LKLEVIQHLVLSQLSVVVVVVLQVPQTVKMVDLVVELDGQVDLEALVSLDKDLAVVAQAEKLVLVVVVLVELVVLGQEQPQVVQVLELQVA
jgi:hypothetical protein